MLGFGAMSGARGDNAGVADGALTPAMRQYRAAKEQYPGTLLFFRMGDFYELFFDDAVTAARELQLTLTARDKARSVPMCGVPYHAAEGYLQRLLRKGYRVAVCEQMEDPKLAKGVVKREVTRVHTPGTAMDPSTGAGESCWLAAVWAREGAKGAEGCYGLAFADLSTGEMRATEMSGAAAWGRVVGELQRMRPAELLVSDRLSAVGAGTQRLPMEGAAGVAGWEELSEIRTRTPMEDWVFQPEYATPLLERQMGVRSLDGLGLGGKVAAAGAAAAVVEYLQRTKQGALEHLDGVRFYAEADCLQMDGTTVRNLELVEPLFAGGEAGTTLLCTVDLCQTLMGKRLLRATLLRPLVDERAIEGRYEAVAELVTDLRKRETLRQAMEGFLDLERLLGRVAVESAGPRELLALRRTLERLTGVVAAVGVLGAELWRGLASGFDPVEDVAARIGATLEEEAIGGSAERSLIRGGISAELDELRTVGRTARSAVAAMEERERARTGIASLKVRFNNVFGFYLEVTKANARHVPADYERKQTLVNAERYTTPELKEFETKILTAEERCGALEAAILAELRGEALRAARRIREAARRVAMVDLLTAFADLAAHRGWTRPVLERETGVLEVLGGRHPVVELRMEQAGVGRFVPNSLLLDATEGASAATMALITGPNMGGKSTFLRMTALLVVLAQAGSFVPAERMRFGLVDRIFTRIGASDSVATGRSTFMVEMTETAAILNLATRRSLLLLDEMGRGTATYDGLSLAWAAVEHLHAVVRARALFATHYHELTELPGRLPRLENLRVTVQESGGGIVFLHTVEAGAASRSYGIEVARLAGLPRAVIERAREVLRLHEREAKVSGREGGAAAQETAVQMTIFTPLSQRIVDRVAALDLDAMTPREALGLLAELQEELRGGTA